MGVLRERMEQDLVLHGRAERTRESYLHWVSELALYYRRLRIPTQAEHLFRLKPNTDSDGSRSPVPSEAEH